MAERVKNVPVRTPFFRLERTDPREIQQVIRRGPTRPWLDWIASQIRARINQVLGEPDFSPWLRVGAGTSSTTISAWEQIGGDGLNSSWSGKSHAHAIVHNVTDGVLYIAVDVSAGDSGEVWEYDLASGDFTKIGGDSVNSSWGSSTGTLDLVLSDDDTKLYAGLQSGAGKAQVWEYDIAGGSWTQIGPHDGSNWASNEHAFCNVGYYSDRPYAMVSGSNDELECWKYDGSGTSWTQVGGNGLNSSWDIDSAANQNAFVADDDFLYALIGHPGSPHVYRWNDTAWEKIGGDGVNSSWTTEIDRAFSGAVSPSHLFIGGHIGAEVWRFDKNAETWDQIGGDGLNNSWSGESLTSSLEVGGVYLYAGINPGEVWRTRLDSLDWEQIGGDSIDSSWSGGAYDDIRSLAPVGDDLYAGGAFSSGDGDLWRREQTTTETTNTEPLIRPRNITDAVAVGEGLTPVAQESINSALYYAWNITSGAHEISQSSQELLDSMSGASVSTTNLVPAGAYDVVIVGEVETEITGASDFDAGDGTDVDLFGAGLGLTVGTQFGPEDYTTTIARYDYVSSGLDVTLTANISNFTAGAVRITAFYKTATAG